MEQHQVFNRIILMVPISMMQVIFLLRLQHLPADRAQAQLPHHLATGGWGRVFDAPVRGLGCGVVAGRAAGDECQKRGGQVNFNSATKGR